MKCQKERNQSPSSSASSTYFHGIKKGCTHYHLQIIKAFSGSQQNGPRCDHHADDNDLPESVSILFTKTQMYVFIRRRLTIPVFANGRAAQNEMGKIGIKKYFLDLYLYL